MKQNNPDNYYKIIIQNIFINNIKKMNYYLNNFELTKWSMNYILEVDKNIFKEYETKNNT